MPASDDAAVRPSAQPAQRSTVALLSTAVLILITQKHFPQPLVMIGDYDLLDYLLWATGGLIVGRGARVTVAAGVNAWRRLVAGFSIKVELARRNDDASSDQQGEDERIP